MTRRLQLVRFALRCSTVLVWSAGATLPPSAGEAVLRPLAARSLASGSQSASMACALQKFVFSARTTENRSNFSCTAQLDSSSGRELAVPQRVEELAEGEDRDSPHPPKARLQTHTQVALQLLFLSQRPQRLQVLRRHVVLGLDLDGRVVPEDEVHFEAGGRTPVVHGFAGHVVSPGDELME